MFFPEGQVRVFVYGEPVSMRLSFDGLYGLTKNVLGMDPLSGNLFAFINRRSNRSALRDRRSAGLLRRIELGDEFDEVGLERGIVVLGVWAHEVDEDFAIEVGGFTILSTRLADHAEPVVAVVHFGITDQQLASGAFGFVESASVNQVDDGVGVLVELVVVVR
jgi:hypothetical protein